jgi:synaptobrevin family protein YKT6
VVIAQMKLIFLSIYKTVDKDTEPIRLYAIEELSDYWLFDRQSIREYLRFSTRTAAQKTEKGCRQMLNVGNNFPFTLYVQNQSDGLACCLVADDEYPKRAAFGVISAALHDFSQSNGNYEDQKQDVELSIPEFDGKFKKYVDPTEADKLMKIQKDLDEVQSIMVKNINDVLERGEKLNDLARRSKEVSDAAVQWADLAEKNNRCCKLW